MSAIPDLRKGKLNIVKGGSAKIVTPQAYIEFCLDLDDHEQLSTGKKYDDNMVDWLMPSLRVQAAYDLKRNQRKDLNI